MPKPPTLRQVGHLDIFVSSTTEPGAQHLRDEIDAIVADINVNLRESGRSLHLDVFHWWQVPPQKVRRGKVNDLFVQRALHSDQVIALLVRFMRPGTREEILAAHGGDVPLSVLYFPPDGKSSRSHWRLRLFMRWLRKNNLYKEAGDAYAAPAVDALRSVMSVLVFRHLGGEVAHERR